MTDISVTSIELEHQNNDDVSTLSSRTDSNMIVVTPDLPWLATTES